MESGHSLYKSKGPERKVKGFPLGDREPLVSAVPNLQGFRSPRRAAGAAFCPVPGKPWRKGREGQKGRGKSGRGEATTAPKAGGDAGSGAAGRSSVRDALPDSFPTCTKRSRLPDPPPRLVGGWEENAIPISQVEKLRFERAKGLGWKQGLPVPTPASGSAALKSPARAQKPEPQTGSTTREASGQGRIRRGRRLQDHGEFPSSRGGRPGARGWEPEIPYCVQAAAGRPSPPLLQEALPDFHLDRALLPPAHFMPLIVFKGRRGALHRREHAAVLLARGLRRAARPRQVHGQVVLRVPRAPPVRHARRPPPAARRPPPRPGHRPRGARGARRARSASLECAHTHPQARTGSGSHQHTKYAVTHVRNAPTC
ncbi:unnamed protein product [Nyctereutes procyonoides]|uniref:(raccoon dog) hypothetical protein n=1 Tax=Nyctereutes procyonoides TaxID=34880 RepID=A0A811YE80_NYCPR|nr:unnamed protein product [Nyctereutes procyonoides]